MILPRAKQIVGQINHLLSKLQTGRCTFLRILWNSKISPTLEYGSAVWSSYVDNSTIAAVNNFQREYFRKAMGLPKKTSFEAMLCDAAVLKQSHKFEIERTKLRIKLDLDICPRIVKKQVTAYKKSPQNKVKYFRGQSKAGVVHLRDRFIHNYPSCVIVPKRENFDSFVSSLRRSNQNTVSGYRLVYECNSDTNP